MSLKPSHASPQEAHSLLSRPINTKVQVMMAFDLYMEFEGHFMLSPQETPRPKEIIQRLDLNESACAILTVAELNSILFFEGTQYFKLLSS